MALLGETAISASILIRVINSASRDLAQVEGEMKAAGLAGASAGVQIGALAGALGHVMVVAGALPAAVTAFSAGIATKFGQAQATISAFTTASQKQITEFSNKILELAPKVGMSPIALEQGLYRLVSAGLKVNTAFALLTQSAKAAGASQSNLSDVTNAADSVVNAYHLGVKGAVLTIDQMTQATKGGKATFQELSAAMQPLLYYAPQLGVSFGQLMAAYSTMSMQGVKYRQVGTDINQLLAKSIAPTKSMMEAASLLGVSWQDLYNVKGKGLVGFIKGLDQASNLQVHNQAAVEQQYHVTAKTIDVLSAKMRDSTGVLRQLTGNQSAYVAVSKLSGAGAADFAKQLDLQSQASDRGTMTNRALAEANKSAAQQFKDFKAAIESATVYIGDAVLPALAGISQAFMPVIAAITHFAKLHSTVTGAALLIGTAILGIGLVLMGLSRVFRAAQATGELWTAASEIQFFKVGGGLDVLGAKFTGFFAAMNLDFLKSQAETDVWAAAEQKAMARAAVAMDTTTTDFEAQAVQQEAALNGVKVATEESALQLQLFATDFEAVGVKADATAVQLGLFSGAEVTEGVAADAAAVQTGLLTGALVALQVVLDALGIGLIILAIVAFIVVMVELITHVQQLSNVFIALLTVLLPPVGIILILAKNFGALKEAAIDLWSAIQEKLLGIWNLLGDAIGAVVDCIKNCIGWITSVTDKLIGLQQPLNKVTSGFNLLGQAVKTAGNFFNWITGPLQAVGHALDKAAHEHDVVKNTITGSAGAVTAAMKSEAHEVTSAHQKMASSVKAWSGAATAADKAVIASRNRLLAQDAAVLKSMEQTVNLHFTAMGDKAILQAKRMADGVIAEANRMKAELAKPIQIGPIERPADLNNAISSAADKVKGQVEQHVSADTAVQFTPNAIAAMKGLTTAVQQLPPQFQGMMNPLIDSAKTKIQQAYNDYLDKVTKENDRDAAKINSIHQGLVDKLKTIYESAQTKEAALKQDYLSKLSTIEQHHADLIAYATEQFAAKMQSGVADFQAKIAASNASLQGIEANHNAQLSSLLADHRNKMDQLQKAGDAKKVASEEASYQKQVANLNRSYANQIAAAQRHVNGMDASFSRGQSKSDQSFAAYINHQNVLYNQQIAKLNGWVKTHHDSIVSAMNTADQKAESWQTQQLAIEQRNHKQYIKDLHDALTKHVRGINQAIAKLGDAGSIWTELKKQVDDVATGAMNQLQVAIIEGKKNLDGLTEAVVRAQAAQQKMTDAVNKAAILVAEKSGDFTTAVKKMEDAVNNKVSSALAKLTFDLVNHTGSVQKDQQALERAYLAQEAYSKKQAAVADVQAKAQLAAAKAAGDFATVLKMESDKTTKTYDEALSKYEYDYIHHTGNLEKDSLALEKATTSLNHLKASTDAAASAAAKAAVTKGGPGAMVNTDSISSELTKATDKFVADSLAHSGALAQDTANIQFWAKQSEAEALAKARATQISDAALQKAAVAAGDFTTAMEKTKSALDNNLTAAENKYAFDLMNHTGNLANDTAALQKAAQQQQVYTDSMTKAQGVVDSIDKSFTAFKNSIDTAASSSMDNLTQKLYDIQNGITDNLPPLADLEKAAYAAQQQQVALTAAQKQATDIVDKMNSANMATYDSAVKVAQANYDAALAAYENAVVNNHTAADLLQLKQAAIDAAVALNTLTKIPDEITKAADAIINPPTSSSSANSGQLTAQQQQTDQLRQQKQALAENTAAQKDGIAQQKLNLAQQKALAAQQNKTSQQTNALLTTQNQYLRDQLAASLETVALQNKMLALSRMGLNRVTVGTSTLGNLNTLGGSSHANVTK